MLKMQDFKATKVDALGRMLKLSDPARHFLAAIERPGATYRGFGKKIAA